MRDANHRPFTIRMETFVGHTSEMDISMDQMPRQHLTLHMATDMVMLTGPPFKNGKRNA